MIMEANIGIHAKTSNLFIKHNAYSYLSVRAHRLDIHRASHLRDRALLGYFYINFYAYRLYIGITSEATR